jgi:hypothetical protein
LRNFQGLDKKSGNYWPLPFSLSRSLACSVLGWETSTAFPAIIHIKKQLFGLFLNTSFPQLTVKRYDLQLGAIMLMLD